MVSYCTVGLLVLGSQRDEEERGGEERSREEGGDAEMDWQSSI